MKVYNAKIKIVRFEAPDKWCNVGTAFELPDGQINLVLDTMPVISTQWDGTIALFPRKSQ